MSQSSSARIVEISYIKLNILETHLIFNDFFQTFHTFKICASTKFHVRSWNRKSTRNNSQNRNSLSKKEKEKKSVTADSKNFDLDKFQYAHSVEQNMNMKIVNNKFSQKIFLSKMYKNSKGLESYERNVFKWYLQFVQVRHKYF